MKKQMAVPLSECISIGTVIVHDDSESSLPLEHTDVVAQVTGPVASVCVTQRFGNPFTHPIELVYLFPLPHEAAVVGFELKIGDRVIKSKVEESEVARREYEEARDAGKRAGLVEERRPNLFSIEIANVQPHETIVATLRYHERVRFDDGEYRFIFPMGLTPKYHHDAREAARTDAPIASAGSAIGTVDVQLSIDAGVALADPKSSSHAIEVSRIDERRVHVRSAGEIIPNKDFVVRYQVAEDDVRAAAWMATSKPAPTLLVTAIPPRLTGDAEPAPREFVFVIDRSGSMGGGPMSQARNALRACVRALGDRDTFAIIAFDNVVEWLKPSAIDVTQQAVLDADRWIGDLHARGGTDIITAVKEALALRRDAMRQRYIVFLTDGAVSAEKEVLTAIRKEIGSGRIFTFGIGPSVNRALLTSMAAQGKGTAEFLQLDEDIEEALIRFQDRVAYPAVQDIRVEWKNAKAWDVYPPQLTDLYHGQPLELTARVAPNENAAIVISGTRGDDSWRTEIALPQPVDDPAITRVWAKARVDALLAAIDNESKDSSLRSEVIALAIEHHLITRYTSLVAIDEEATKGAASKRIRVAVPLPEGLVLEGFTGSTPFGGAMPIAMQAGMLSAPSMVMRARSAQPPSVPRRSAAPPAAFEMLAHDERPRREEDDDPLRMLARTQNVSGSWGSAENEIELTSAAILAFVRRGHTTRSGNYRRQLAKAVRWLTAAANATGIAAVARAIALAEMGDAIGDASLSALRSNVTVPASLDELRAAALDRRAVSAGAKVDSTASQIWRAAIVG
jgi:Ca-activated chloride channel family protein